MAEGKSESFQEFWLSYLKTHAHSGTRSLHYLGTTLGLVGCVVTIVTLDIRFAAAGMILGYLVAWAGHILIEKNRPRAFSRPVWSLMADLRMFWLWLVGRLDRELKDAGVPIEK
jgi:hypothetical protein